MKKLLFTFLAISFYSASAQTDEKLWHHSDLEQDGIPGVSLDQAYDYLGDRPSKKVIVAIIDSGYELDHEAFINKLWVNEGEIAGNGKDDDGNGYADDINGWNFIGGPEGNITNETLELTREYRKLKAKYENAKPSKSAEYKYWKEIEEAFLKESGEMQASAEGFFANYNSIPYNYQLLAGYAQVDTLTLEALNTINSSDSTVLKADAYLTNIVNYLGGSATIGQIMELFEGGYSYYDYQYNYAYNPDFDPRPVVGDDLTDLSQKGYGNARIDDVDGYGGSHGTHVAGIVGGENYGITSNVEFMFIRAVPSGDERDKDVANAIMYAVDNGAKVVNMSFGKGYSPEQDIVRKAVKYAESKGVVLVHAAGNDGSNNDEVPSYPDGSITSKKRSKVWIEVGASSSNYDENLPASFSNYGKSNVDLFAPGVAILSSVPENTYKANSGTSMAAPVVAGVSALLLSYFPDLSATDVKDILLKSVSQVDLQVNRPGSKDKVQFSELSKTGGIVNAYKAVKLADQRVKIQKN